MLLGAGAHRAVAGELTEWWEDIATGGIGSQVVLLAVPPGWGRSAVLQQLTAAASSDDGPVTLVVPLGGNLPPGRALQAQALREALTSIGDEPRVVRLLELDTAAGQVQLGLGLGGLLASGLPAAASLLVASLAVTAAGNVWDGSPAGEAGGVAQAARALARRSVSVPVVVTIDDADCLDTGLALALIRGLASRLDGQVLVVVAAAPGSELAGALTKEPGYDLAGRVQRADADPSMDYAARVELARELLPGLPAAGAERIARRTAAFAQVFAVARAGRLAELDPSAGAAEAVGVVDAVTDGVLEQAKPSPEAIVLAWSGGALHVRQATAALAALGAEPRVGDQRVVRAGSLVRLAGPVDARVAALFQDRRVADRQEVAAAVVNQAAVLAANADAGLVERVVARQAAHHIRGDLADRSKLAGVQLGLVRGLESLGDPDAAYEVATTALAELDAAFEAGDAGQRQELVMAVLRVSRTRSGSGQAEDVVAEAVELATSGGAAVRLEARVWAGVDLLNRPGRRQAGLQLARQVTDELETRNIHGDLAAQWRLLLAFHVGRAGDPALAQRLLATLINSGTAQQQDAASAILYAIGDYQADTRLQLILIQEELSRTPADADDDLLRLHHALAGCFDALGDYRQALHHGAQELSLRDRLQGNDHPQTLTSRSNVASWTGESGDAAGALRLFKELLPDLVKVLGPDHLSSLTVRNNIALWTGNSGDAAGALRLSKELLPDLIRVLGPHHPRIFNTRGNIAGWAGESGDAAGALRLFEELLPDLVKVLGPHHPDTLTVRNNIALWTGQSGDAAGALRLSKELLPDQVRVLGPDHPDTLNTRGHIAASTGESGDVAGALRLSKELLPDLVKVLGPHHPATLNVRGSIAAWTGYSGDVAGALRLSKELLPDLVKVLGPDHPHTLATRVGIAAATGENGDAAGALRLFKELLPDMVQVLGPDHPHTIVVRNRIAFWMEVTAGRQGPGKTEEPDGG